AGTARSRRSRTEWRTFGESAAADFVPFQPRFQPPGLPDEVHMIPTPEQHASFEAQGYFIADSLFDVETLDQLTEEFDRIRAEEDAALGEGGRRGITHRGRRYFLA